MVQWDTVYRLDEWQAQGLKLAHYEGGVYYLIPQEEDLNSDWDWREATQQFCANFSA